MVTPNAQSSENISEKKVQRASYLIGANLKAWWVKMVLAPLELACIRFGITPNQITLISSTLYLAVFWLYANNHLLAAGWSVLVLASLDILDGRVARATGKVTNAGAFLDSVMDRYQDGLMLMGVVVLFKDSWVFYFALAALMGSFLVSYTRSKAQELGIDLAEIGAMQRPERIFLIGFGSILSSLISISIRPFTSNHMSPPHYLFMLVIIFLALTANVTAVKRISYTLRNLRD